MFVRRTRTRATGGAEYHTHRLVRSERDGDRVRQRTLLNLGRHFALAREHWPLLCQRTEELLAGQTGLPMDCPPEVEAEAQRIAARLAGRGAATVAADSQGDVRRVDVDSLELARARSVGVESAALWAMDRLRLRELLAELGLGPGLLAAAVGNVVGRMAHPASERETRRWLAQRSGLGELLGADFETMGSMRLYRASDALLAHRDALEDRLFERASGLFGLAPTVTLYDLTNTFFEGAAAAMPKAARGRSKEKRGDCPLLTLGLALDASGFVRRSRVFAGNVVESATLAEMLRSLDAPQSALVVMDRGVATDDRVSWLRREGYRHLVVSREARREFDGADAVSIRSKSGETVRLVRELSDDGLEVRLRCHSEARERKERGIAERFARRFEKALDELSAGLSRPRAHRKIERVWERIGRIKEKNSRAARHYDVQVAADESGEKAAAVAWTRRPDAGSMAAHPGVYCLRSSETEWDEETLWRTYATLTDVEAVFRSLKSELGLRPIYHRKQARAEGHLFIAVLAYQLVQVIRAALRQKGVDGSWNTLRDILEGQQRVTATFRCADGRALHVRKATRAEPALREIYDALGIDPLPGGTRKTVI